MGEWSERGGWGLARGVLWACLVTAGCGPDALQPGATLIENVKLVAMDGPQVVEGVSVVVRDGSIERISTPGGVRAGPDTRVIDGQDGYLLPGLIDAHVHLRSEAELGLYPASGVVAVRNMNGNFGDPLRWRDAVERGELLGPRMRTSSPTLFDESPGYAWHVVGPDRARELARQFRDDGYDLIKVFRLAEPTLRALSDEAAALGIPVAGHYPAPEADLDAILGAGMVSLEHLDELVHPAFGGESDYGRIPEVVERLRESGVAIGTILAQWEAYNRGLDDPDALLTDSLLAVAEGYFGADGPAQLRNVAADIRSRDAASLDGDRSDFDFLFALLAALDDAGVPIVASTDAHQPLAPAGEGLVNELELFVRAGLSPYAALRTATVTAAGLLGWGDQLGTVRVGASADLLLVEENPLEDLTTLRRPVGVMLRGEWLDRARLDQLRENALARDTG